MIKSKQLARALFELGEENTKDLEKKFFEFIDDKNLNAQIPSVLYHLEKIVSLDKTKKEIQIEVAHEIKEDTIKNIKQSLKAENLKENVVIKKELIGGFRAKYDGMIYDSSIMTGIKKLKEQIIN